MKSENKQTMYIALFCIILGGIAILVDSYVTYPNYEYVGRKPIYGEITDKWLKQDTEMKTSTGPLGLWMDEHYVVVTKYIFEINNKFTKEVSDFTYHNYDVGDKIIIDYSSGYWREIE